MSHCTEVTGSTTIVERDPDIVVTESSLDFRSVENESTVTDGCGVVCASVRFTHAAKTNHWHRNNKTSRLSVTLRIFLRRALLNALWMQTLLSPKARLLMGADL